MNGSLVSNPYSWTKHASLVFLEQPVGVGFSYGTAEEELLGFNDYRAATDNILAIKAFFKKFPERASQPFYIASESYGGHYIPQWTLQILGDESLRGRFKGMLVGNPFTSYASGSVAMAHVMWGLQMIPAPLW
jgi:carboxypeptidase C (cathepsin A)